MTLLSESSHSFALALSSHLGTFTPFTRSQRQSDASAIKGGNRITGNSLAANVGARISAKLLIR